MRHPFALTLVGLRGQQLVPQGNRSLKPLDHLVRVLHKDHYRCSLHMVQSIGLVKGESHKLGESRILGLRHCTLQSWTL